MPVLSLTLGSHCISLLALVSTGGALIGLAFGIAMRYVLRWMRHLGAGIEQQVAMTFAVGYLSYYTANAPAAVSGQHSQLMSAFPSYFLDPLDPPGTYVPYLLLFITVKIGFF